MPAPSFPHHREGPGPRASVFNFSTTRSRAVEDTLYYSDPEGAYRRRCLPAHIDDLDKDDKNPHRFILRVPKRPILTEEDAFFEAEYLPESIKKNFMRVMDRKQPHPPHLAVRICKYIFHGAFMAALFLSPILLLLIKSRRATRG